MSDDAILIWHIHSAKSILLESTGEYEIMQICTQVFLLMTNHHSIP